MQLDWITLKLPKSLPSKWVFLFFKTKIHNYAKTGKSVLYLGRIRAVIFLPILWEGYFQKTKQTNHQFPLPERIAISKHTA